MFQGYFAREYPEMGLAEVCYYDRHDCKTIQTYCALDPKPGTTRHSNFSVVPNPVEEARKLVGLLNGGKDYQRLANAVEKNNDLSVQLIEVVGRVAAAIGDLQDAMADRFPKL